MSNLARFRMSVWWLIPFLFHFGLGGPMDKRANRIQVKLTTQQLISEIADGVTYTHWSFDGKVPGPLIRVRQNDWVEVELVNDGSSQMPHSINVMAVTGAGEGATHTLTAPGEQSSFRFQATQSGLFMYYSAAAPIGMQVSNGLYGLILVEPMGGLPAVDHEFIVVQQEVYTAGRFGEEGLQSFSMQDALDERPTYVVYNGKVGSLTGDGRLQAKSGETIRILFANAGPNQVASFRVIGEQFDRIFEGSLDKPSAANRKWVSLPPLSAAVLELQVESPGRYVLCENSLYRAFNKGALGYLEVSGESLKDIYAGSKQSPAFLPEGGAVQFVDRKADAPTPKFTMEAKLQHGKRIYEANCLACHQPGGTGIPGSFPPLIQSDFFVGNDDRAIMVILEGLEGKIVVNDITYNGKMPAMKLTDQEIAAVLTYIKNSWNNPGGEVSIEKVRYLRSIQK